MSLLTRWRTLAGVMLMSLLLGCYGGGRQHTPQGNLEVMNDGTVQMTQLFVTPSSSANWGVDQLAPDILPPAESLTLTGLDADSYDVQAHFADGSVDEVFDVPVDDGLTTVVSTANNGTGTVAVFNDSALPINEIYLTRTKAMTWGPNQADAPLAAGATLDLTGIAPGTYDLKVVFVGGSSALPPAFTVSAGITATIPVL